MRAIFEALTWGPWVDQGDSAPRYCTIGGVAKANNADNPYRAANEYVAAELGRIIGLPAVPGVVVSNNELSGFVSLRFGSKGEKPPPAIPELFAHEQPDLAAGLVVFDCWIGNTDRHEENFAYSVTNKRTHIFDHDRALLSAMGLRRLELHRDEHGLDYHTVAHALESGAKFASWVEAVSRVTQRTIELVVRELQEHGLLTEVERTALIDFLLHRRGRIAEMLQVARKGGCFPSIVQGFLL